MLQECVDAGESSAYHKILKCFVDKMKNDGLVSFQDLENVKFIFDNVQTEYNCFYVMGPMLSAFVPKQLEALSNKKQLMRQQVNKNKYALSSEQYMGRPR